MNRALFKAPVLKAAIAVALCCAGVARAQSTAPQHMHRLTVGFGALNPAGNDLNAALFNSSPLLSADYGYRFHRYSQADIGVDTGFASDKTDGKRRNVYIPRFGYRLIIPLMDDRIEAHVGAGAGYGFLKPTVQGFEGWLVYGQTGANYAIDAERKYRAGMTVRWLRNPIGTPSQQWVSVSADFTWNFGR